ncbi:hypothetical protein [Spirosoma sp. KNUC1025]
MLSSSGPSGDWIDDQQQRTKEIGLQNVLGASVAQHPGAACPYGG